MRKLSKDDISYFLQGLKKKRVKCPYCGSVPVVYARKYFVIEICRCLDCGLFFVNPFYLPKEGIESFYNDSYSSDATELPNVGSLELMKMNNFSGSRKDYNSRLIIIRELSNGNRLLEFGCSWGYFLFQAKTYGFESIGTEISKKRADFGRKNLGVNIFEDIASVEGGFDLICSFHVLEHLTDLSTIFDEFHKRLLPSGSLIIEVPNFDPETRGEIVHSIIGKVHPLGFCKNFFERNLSRHGFSGINIAGSYEDLLKNPKDRLTPKDIIVVYAEK
jgi:SAM-dependent methyltransferase/ribosomal protein S27E